MGGRVADFLGVATDGLYLESLPYSHPTILLVGSRLKSESVLGFFLQLYYFGEERIWMDGVDPDQQHWMALFGVENNPIV
jgi:hypothetical protein